MKHLTVTLRGTSPISFSKFPNTEKENESHDEYEERVWPEKAHYNSDGYVIIPGNFLRQGIPRTAKLLAIPIKGSSLFTKHFESGFSVIGSINTGVHRDNLEHEWVHCSSDGSIGGRKKVLKCFPVIKDAWEGSFDVIIADPVLCENMQVVERVLKANGILTGFGRWRPQNRGSYGMYEVVEIKENGNNDKPTRKRRKSSK